MTKTPHNATHRLLEQNKKITIFCKYFNIFLARQFGWVSETYSIYDCKDLPPEPFRRSDTARALGQVRGCSKKNLQVGTPFPLAPTDVMLCSVQREGKASM